jgi:hypothetical protein
MENGKNNNKNIATILITNGLGFINTPDILVDSEFEYDIIITL